jgi:hypothetical protein
LERQYRTVGLADIATANGARVSVIIIRQMKPVYLFGEWERGRGFNNLITGGAIYIIALNSKWNEVLFILRLAMRSAACFVLTSSAGHAQQIMPPFGKLSKCVTMFHYRGAFFRFETE